MGSASFTLCGLGKNQSLGNHSITMFNSIFFYWAGWVFELTGVVIVALMAGRACRRGLSLCTAGLLWCSSFHSWWLR